MMHAACLTDKGLVRKQNEDAVFANDATGLFAVADGMGGHGMGDVASKMCLDTLKQTLQGVEPPPPAPIEIAQDDDMTLQEAPDPMSDAVRDAVEQANTEIYSLNASRGASKGSGMGATLAGFKVFDNLSRAVVFHVGDSRIYRLRGGVLVRLTRDHSVYEEWKREGGNGKAPFRNFILRAVGPNPSANPEISVQAVLQGDIWLACSDGLTGMVQDDDIEKILRQARPDTLQDAAQALVNRAKERGGKDNIGVVLAART